jgi:hypothetical protein
MALDELETRGPLANAREGDGNDAMTEEPTPPIFTQPPDGAETDWEPTQLATQPATQAGAQADVATVEMQVDDDIAAVLTRQTTPDEAFGGLNIAGQEDAPAEDDGMCIIYL